MISFYTSLLEPNEIEAKMTSEIKYINGIFELVFAVLFDIMIHF